MDNASGGGGGGGAGDGAGDGGERATINLHCRAPSIRHSISYIYLLQVFPIYIANKIWMHHKSPTKKNNRNNSKRTCPV